MDLLANFDYGTASEQVGGDGRRLDRAVRGIITLGGGLLDESLADWSFALRGEWFSDPDGYRTGIEQDLREVTGTFKWQMTENLQARLEFRHDWSNKDVFDDGGGYSGRPGLDDCGVRLPDVAESLKGGSDEEDRSDHQAVQAR